MVSNKFSASPFFPRDAIHRAWMDEARGETRGTSQAARWQRCCAHLSAGLHEPGRAGNRHRCPSGNLSPQSLLLKAQMTQKKHQPAEGRAQPDRLTPPLPSWPQPGSGGPALGALGAPNEAPLPDRGMRTWAALTCPQAALDTGPALHPYCRSPN